MENVTLEFKFTAPVGLNENDNKHCNNLCPQMTIDCTCDLFRMELKWDRRRKYDGYLRCNKCLAGKFPR